MKASPFVDLHSSVSDGGANHARAVPAGSRPRIQVYWSWFIIVVLLTWTLPLSSFPSVHSR